MRSLFFLLIFCVLFTLSCAQCPVTTTCGQCIQSSGCGWCETTETCVAGNSEGPGGDKDNCTNWQITTCFDEECRAKPSCETCGQDPFCGFCLSTNQCVYGTKKNPVDSSCKNYTFSGSLCPSTSPKIGISPSGSKTFHKSITHSGTNTGSLSPTHSISPSHIVKKSKKQQPPPPPPSKKPKKTQSKRHQPPPPPPPPPPPSKKPKKTQSKKHQPPPPPPPPPSKKPKKTQSKRHQPPPPPPPSKKPKKTKSKKPRIPPPPPPNIVSPVLSAILTPIFVSTSSAFSLVPQTLLLLFSFVIIGILNRNL